jgi:AdoMet-dependent heme synthase
MSLMYEMQQKAMRLGIPLDVHIDVTYRCNERCIHCYLDHDDQGELSTLELKQLLQQLAEVGVFTVTFSGGEVFMRRDFLELVEYARALLFNVRIKTNAVMIGEREAQRLRALAIEQVQVSVYSHRAEIHDAITKLPGSFRRTMDAIRLLRSQGLKLVIANVLMTANMHDHAGVRSLAKELDVQYRLDPTITPKLDGNSSILNLRIPGTKLKQVLQDEDLVSDVNEFCSPPTPASADDLESYPCSAGHSSCYISPYGDVFPCVQFPLPSGNVRQHQFRDIWRGSPELQQVRSIRLKDLPVCSTCAHANACTRCPGLAYMEGSMRGPSSADCQKSFQRTGIPSANMMLQRDFTAVPQLVQIQPLSV